MDLGFPALGQTMVKSISILLEENYLRILQDIPTLGQVPMDLPLLTKISKIWYQELIPLLSTKDLESVPKPKPLS